MSEQIENNYTTILNGSITSSDATIVVDTGPSAMVGNFTIRIDDEIIYVRNVDGVTFSQCKRGQEGTTAASHADNADVTHVLTRGALGTFGVGQTNRQLELLGLVDSWNDAAGVVTSRGQTLTNVTRVATGGPNSEPALEATTGAVGSWVFNPGDVIQIEADIRSVTGGASWLRVITQAGNFTFNNLTDNTWAHYRGVFTIGSLGYLRMDSLNTVRVSNLFMYKITQYPVVTAWDAGDANTTLDGGQTWGGGSSRHATNGRFGDACIDSDSGAGPSTMLTVSGLVNAQVFRVEGVFNILSGGGTEFEAVVTGGTTVINTNNTIGWQFFAANVTVGTSFDIAFRNNFSVRLQDFKLIQIGA